MSSQNDDILPIAYKYAWSKDSDLPLDDFLSKYKPSMVQNDGAKPWIWVKRSESSLEDGGESEAMREASATLKKLTEKVDSIKNDSAIPLRSNKKTGAKSKKEVREQAQAEATKELEEISTMHSFVSGKWLIFAPSEKIDVIWSSIAKSLVSGPLSSTSAYLAKVATSPEDESPNYQHIICLYMPNVYDKESVSEVMKILLRNHGVNLSGVKSNLYTSIGIDSKHPSGIQSTIWKNSALLPDSEAKELKDAYFAEIASQKPDATATKIPPQVQPTASSSQGEEFLSPKSKPQPKLKKKMEDDPFASESDDSGEGKPKEKVKLQKTTTAKANKRKTTGEEDGAKKSSVKLKRRKLSEEAED